MRFSVRAFFRGELSVSKRIFTRTFRALSVLTSPQVKAHALAK